MKLKSVIALLIILMPLSLSWQTQSKAQDCNSHYVPVRRVYRKDFTQECKDFHYRGRKAFCRTEPRKKLCPNKQYSWIGSNNK